MPGYYANQLAEFICNLDTRDLPPEVIDKAKVSILDNLGLTLGGSKSPAAQAVVAAVGPSAGAGRCTVVGSQAKVSACLAALVNGTMCHSNDYTDTILATVIHCGPVVVPTALAMAEMMDLDGASTILLVVTGYEIAARVSFAINSKPAMVHHRKGFHATSTCGVFGAAAIAAKALELDADKVAHAIGIAGSSASGIIESITGPIGADTFRTHPGKAGHDGILAALFAQHGLTGPHTVFEGRDGFLHAFSDNDQYSGGALVEELGQRFSLMDVAIKFHNGTHAIASSVDALQSIMSEHVLQQDGIERIEAHVPTMHAYIGGADRETLYAPPTYSKAQMSLPFALATTALYNELFIEQYSFEKLHNPATLALARKVTVLADAEMDRLQNEGKWPARVCVITTDGGRYEAFAEYPKGSPQRPLTTSEVERKFRRLSAGSLDADRQARMIDAVASLERCENVRELADLLVAR